MSEVNKPRDPKEQSEQISGILGWIERIGNALPHPAMIFVFFSALVIIISAVVAKYGAPVTFYDAKAGEDVTQSAVSLLNWEGLRYIFNNATSNFMDFAPLGTVLVTMLGVGVAEWSGLINTALKKLLSNVNPRLLTAIVIFAGVMSNIASGAGYVVVIPLGAIVFAGAGRHPIAGLAAAFAGVSGGFSANLIIGTMDPLLAGITNEALMSGRIDYQIVPTANWYFMIVSTFLVVGLGTFVTEKIVVKNLGEYRGDYVPTDDPVTEKETKGLRNAGIALLVLAVIMGLLMFLPNAPFKTLDEDGILNLNEFMSNGLLVLILLAFMVPGIVYGKTVGKLNDNRDLVEAMTVAMKGMAGYLVLSFFASQFIDYFSHTNLGTILSVNGAGFLESIGFKGLPLLLSFIFISALINLFMGSASAKWAIMAPVFVPMLYKMGLSPELTQAAYRIGDSTTNLITPLMEYFAMIVVFAQKYDKESGLGTIISTMVPYSVVFLVGWSVLIAVWFALGLPLGPGASTVVSMLL